MMPKFSKTEFKYIALTAIVLAFVFALDDKQPKFQPSFWLTNFLITIIFALIVIIIHQLGHKIIGLRYKVHTEHRTWFIERFWFSSHAKFKFKNPLTNKTYNCFPIGIFLAILTTLISKGKIYLVAIETFIAKEHPSLRLGHRWSNLPEFELAIIALAGPAANILFSLILASFNHNNIFDMLILMNYTYGLTAMIPISHLDGCKIFFGSKVLYVFGLIFLILCAVLINILTATQTLIFSIILSSIIALLLSLRLLD